MIQTQGTKLILGFNIGTQYKIQKSFSNVEETVLSLFQKPFVGKKTFSASRCVHNLQLLIRRQQISLKLLNKTPWDIIKFTTILCNFICQLVMYSSFPK